MKIEDGTGSGKLAKVDSENRLRTSSVTETEALHAAEEGRGYNINTGFISVIGNASLIYLKNNGDSDVVLASIIVGLFNGITHSDDPYFTITRNPTGGDIISDATAVEANVNRNFGSSATLTVNVYKGKVGGTITGGTNFGKLQLNPATRNFYGVEIVIPKGSSIALALTANVSSGSANGYAAFICYEKEDTTD